MSSLEFVNKGLHSFQGLFFIKYFLDDYVKNEMGRECRMHGREEKYMECFSE